MLRQPWSLALRIAKTHNSIYDDEFDDPDDHSAASDFMARLKPGTPEFERLKASIEEAQAEIARTGGTPLDFEEIKRKGRELLAKRRGQLPAE